MTYEQVVLVIDQSMMLVHILLALLNSKFDPYGANLLIGKVCTEQSGTERTTRLSYVDNYI